MKLINFMEKACEGRKVLASRSNTLLEIDVEVQDVIRVVETLEKET